MEHQHEHRLEAESGPRVSAIRRGVSILVNGVMNGFDLGAEVGGTLAGRTVRSVGKVVQSFARALFGKKR